MIPVNTNYSKTEYQPFPNLSLQNFASITIQNNFTITVCREKTELLNWCKMYKVSTVNLILAYKVITLCNYVNQLSLSLFS